MPNAYVDRHVKKLMKRRAPNLAKRLDVDEEELTENDVIVDLLSENALAEYERLGGDAHEHD